MWEGYIISDELCDDGSFRDITVRWDGARYKFFYTIYGSNIIMFGEIESENSWIEFLERKNNPILQFKFFGL